MHKFTYKYLLLIFIILPAVSYSQQIELRGTVYDYLNKRPIDAVTVQTTSGKGTYTDSLGRYSIIVTDKDSVWFSYINKRTQKFKIDTISNFSSFDVALHVNIAWLPTVTVKSKTYKLDSLQFRKDYAKYFNFKKPGLSVNSISPSNYIPGSLTAGIDLAELINVFRFKRTKSLAALQTRLITQEQDKYIDHRFSKHFVKQLTKLENENLESFMTKYKPSYEMLQEMNDIELGYYIQYCFRQFTSY